MAWVQPVVQGATYAYNAYAFDRDYNSGRVAAYLRNRRRRNPSANMPRGMAIDYKRRRADGADAVGNANYQGGYVNDTHYKRKRTLGKINVNKLAKQGTCALYDRWQRMGKYSRLNGELWLEKGGSAVAQSGALIPPYVTTPMFLWDLTCSKNVIAGVEKVPVSAFSLTRNTATGEFNMNPIASQNIETGTAATDQNRANWQWYSTPKTSAGLDAPIDVGLLDWVKIQAVVYGSKKQSHKVWFEVCQMDPALEPQANYLNLADGLYTTSVGLNTDEIGSRDNAYQNYHNMLAPLIDGPFADIFPSREVRKMYVKVLDRKCIEFQPVSSFEEAGSPIVHKSTLNWFVKMGRKCDFNWKINAPDIANNQAGDNEIETKVERGNHDTHVHPKARVFLRVYSTTYAAVGDNSWTKEEIAPSFDIRISRKWVVSS